MKRPSFSIRFPSKCPLDGVMLKDVLGVLYSADRDLEWILEFWDGNLYEPCDSSLAQGYAERFQESCASVGITWHDLLQLSAEPFQIADTTIVGINQSVSSDYCRYVNEQEYDCMKVICDSDADIIIEVLDFSEWTIFTCCYEHILSLMQLLRDKGLSF